MNSTFILIKSCWTNRDRREAIRQTWLTQLDRERADYAFVLGSHKPDRPYGDPCSNRWNEPDLKIYCEDDGFKHIGPKIRRCFQELIGKYKRVVVLDDDTYAIPGRLLELADTVQEGDYVGLIRATSGCWGTEAYMQGAAYILGSAALYLCATSIVLLQQMPDDVAVGKILFEQVNYRDERRFHPGPLWNPFPAQEGLITTHKVKSSIMPEVHEGVLSAIQHFDQSK